MQKVLNKMSTHEQGKLTTGWPCTELRVPTKDRASKLNSLFHPKRAHITPGCLGRPLPTTCPTRARTCPRHAQPVQGHAHNMPNQCKDMPTTCPTRARTCPRHAQPEQGACFVPNTNAGPTSEHDARGPCSTVVNPIGMPPYE
eukprot:1160390-Pelagomonas_calceolata.AAC.3